MGREDGPGSESEGNAGYGGGGSSSGNSGGNDGMGGNEQDFGAGNYGGGRQDGPGSVTEGNQFGGGQGTASEAGLMDAINSAIAQGMNPYSSTAQNVIAAGLISGKFGSPSNFGISNDAIENPEVAGFVDKYSGQNIGEKALGAFGYDTNKSIGQNIYDTITPGKQTPLGILSALPSVVTNNPVTQLGVTLGNKAMGIMGIGVEKDTTMSSIQDTINDMNSKLY